MLSNTDKAQPAYQAMAPRPMPNGKARGLSNRDQDNDKHRDGHIDGKGNKHKGRQRDWHCHGDVDGDGNRNRNKWWERFITNVGKAGKLQQTSGFPGMHKIKWKGPMGPLLPVMFQKKSGPCAVTFEVALHRNTASRYTAEESATGRSWEGPECGPGLDSAESYGLTPDYRDWYNEVWHSDSDSAGSYYPSMDYHEGYVDYERDGEYSDLPAIERAKPSYVIKEKPARPDKSHSSCTEVEASSAAESVKGACHSGAFSLPHKTSKMVHVSSGMHRTRVCDSPHRSTRKVEFSLAPELLAGSSSLNALPGTSARKAGLPSQQALPPGLVKPCPSQLQKSLPVSSSGSFWTSTYPIPSSLAHLKFANDHLEDSEADWFKVLWSDETKIEVFGADHTLGVCREDGTAYNPKNTIPSSMVDQASL
ncbi:hypothetical protein P4O66_002598 [Electrophorus voltai]|uniref:Uncharacterized protein n=1 Tax=Electrophorus voltai TaxID=2609070 RepID=A0AAD9DR46_9TELE|nr:hypothetical protein P4O66_002598 [Electrophorus voltai]